MRLEVELAGLPILGWLLLEGGVGGVGANQPPVPADRASGGPAVRGNTLSSTPPPATVGRSGWVATDAGFAGSWPTVLMTLLCGLVAATLIDARTFASR